MKKLLLAAMTMTLVATGTAALAPSASAATKAAGNPGAAPSVIGGTRAPSTPWEVQLIFEQGGGTYGCTGEQINAEWVLTANHCADGTTAMDVYHSNSTTNRGAPAPVDALYSAPNGDIALAHLATPYSLGGYAQLDLGYSARTSGSGVIMGYGARANSAQSDGLYQANVSLTGDSTDAYYGDAQHINGTDGASNHGDSGGPLLVGGYVVGVCSTGDSADPGANINAGSNYAILSQAADFISSTAGV